MILYNYLPSWQGALLYITVIIVAISLNINSAHDMVYIHALVIASHMSLYINKTSDFYNIATSTGSNS